MTEVAFVDVESLLLGRPLPPASHPLWYISVSLTANFKHTGFSTSFHFRLSVFILCCALKTQSKGSLTVKKMKPLGALAQAPKTKPHIVEVFLESFGPKWTCLVPWKVFCWEIEFISVNQSPSICGTSKICPIARKLNHGPNFLPFNFLATKVHSF